MDMQKKKEKKRVYVYTCLSSWKEAKLDGLHVEIVKHHTENTHSDWADLQRQMRMQTNIPHSAWCIYANSKVYIKYTHKVHKESKSD